MAPAKGVGVVLQVVVRRRPRERVRRPELCQLLVEPLPFVLPCGTDVGLGLGLGLRLGLGRGIRLGLRLGLGRGIRLGRGLGLGGTDVSLHVKQLLLQLGQVRQLQRAALGGALPRLGHGGAFGDVAPSESPVRGQ